MLTVNGMYNINGKDVYMTFNQEHDGTFGAIISGLTEVRSSGVNERQLDRIPTDEANVNTNTGSSQSSTTNSSNNSSNTDIFGNIMSTGEVRGSDGKVLDQDMVDRWRKSGYTDDMIREMYDQAGGKLGDASGIHWN